MRDWIFLLGLFLLIGAAPGCQPRGDEGVVDAGEADDVQDSADTGQPDGDSLWRSALYPEDWQPADTDEEGRFLHDFSYAGYRNGESLPALDSAYDVDVTDFGADREGQQDATEAIQQAIDMAVDLGGGVVYFPEGIYRVDDVLRVEGSSVVLRGQGPQRSQVYFTRHQEMSYSGHITFAGAPQVIDEVPLAQDVEARSQWIAVDDAGPFEVGDDVELGWIISDEFVADHQMTGIWQAFNGQWQTFFRRTVVDVDADSSPPRVRVDVPTRYEARRRDQAALRKVSGMLSEVGVEALGLANAVDPDAAWEQSQVHLIEFHGVKDGWMRQVESFRPPGLSDDGQEGHLQSSGILIADGKRFTLADLVLENAQHRGPGGNGYLFEIRRSNEILIRDSLGRNGRHNFTQNWGFGTTGCVWLRVTSEGGRAYSSQSGGFRPVAHSDFHHSLATANLIDASVLNDGWSAVNRQSMSGGAGHTATENVFWNSGGDGLLRSLQFGWGYIIGTGKDLTVETEIRDEWGGFEELGDLAAWEHTAPRDYMEGLGKAETLRPQSLYESQRRRRLGHQ